MVVCGAAGHLGLPRDPHQPFPSRLCSHSAGAPDLWLGIDGISRLFDRDTLGRARGWKGQGARARERTVVERVCPRKCWCLFSQILQTHPNPELVALDNRVLAPSGGIQQLVDSCIPGTLDKRVPRVGVWCAASRDPSEEHTDVMDRFRIPWPAWD